MSYIEWKSWRPERFGICTAENAAYFDAELRSCGVPRTGTVLEMGFGNGEFAAWARQQGFQYRGTERESQLVALARAQGYDAHDADVDIANLATPKSLDLIVAFDVLEHMTLEQIAIFFESARSCLKPCGFLLARVPSGDSPFARSIQHGDRTHMSCIGSGLVRQMCATAGLRVVCLKGAAFPIRGFGATKAVRRLMVLGARAVIGRLINAAYHDNQPRVIEPTLVMCLQPPAGQQ